MERCSNELLDNRKEKIPLLWTNDENMKLLHLQDPECFLIQKSEQKIWNGDAQMWIRTTIIRLISPATSCDCPAGFVCGRLLDVDPTFYH